MNQKFIIDQDLKAEFVEISGPYFEFVDIKSCLSKRKIIHSSSIVDGSDSLNFTPIGVVLSSEKLELKDEVGFWLKSLVPRNSNELSEPFIFSPPMYNELLRWFFLKLGQNTHAAAINGLSLSLELARLRTLFERAQRSILRLTDMSRQNDLVPPIAFQVPPGRLPLSLMKSPLEMEIGVRLEAIHAVDIFFNKHNTLLSTETLLVELKGMTTGRIIQSWELKEALIAQGWNRFYCDVQSDPLTECIKIVIVFKVGRLNVTLSVPSVQLSSYTEPTSATGNSTHFAIRVLAGVVGTSLSRPGLTQACEYGAVDGQAPEDGAAMLQLITPLQQEAFAGQFCWRSDLRGFMLHPSGVRPVVGVLENLRAVNVKRLTVRFRLENSAAQATEFAFWAETLDPSFLTVSSWGRNLKRMAFKTVEKVGMKLPSFAPGLELVRSDLKKEVKWVLLFADQRGQIVFEFPEPYSGLVNLFFATKNKGHKNDYSWALFDDFDIEYSK